MKVEEILTGDNLSGVKRHNNDDGWNRESNELRQL